MSEEKTITLSKEEIEQIKKRSQEEADAPRPESEDDDSENGQDR